MKKTPAQKPKMIIELYREHLDYIKAYNTTVHGTVKPVSRAVFYERLKAGWSEYTAIHTPRKESNVRNIKKPKKITNPVEGVDYHYVDNHSKKVDIVVTVMIIIGLLYYFKEQIQDYIALLLS